MKIPEFNPVFKLSHTSSYEENTRQYGKPPKGYRWMNVGEKINHFTDLWAAAGRRWDSRPSDKKVDGTEWPWITPLKSAARPKTDKISLLEAEVAKARAALAAAEEKLSTARELVAKLEAL